MGRRAALVSLVALASHRAGVRADDTLNGAVQQAFGESCFFCCPASAALFHSVFRFEAVEPFGYVCGVYTV